MIQIYRLKIGLCLLAVLAPFNALAQQACDGLLYATDFDKQASHGSKDALLAAVNRGEPIRVGWALDFDQDGEADLSHWADAAFLSVWEGEVFTQVDAIHTQTPQQGKGAIALRKPFTEWRGSLGSNGTLEGRFSDGAAFPSDLSSQITWCSALKGERGWALLYRNDVDGNPVAGSKQALLAAIRSGQPIQIAWGFKTERQGKFLSVEHLISPVFLSIVNESEVSAQLPEHIAQQHYADIDRAFFGDPAVMWRGLMTSKGTFDAVWVNRATGEMLRRHPQRAALSWYAPVSPDLSTPSLAIEGAVKFDSARARDKFPE